MTERRCKRGTIGEKKLLTTDKAAGRAAYPSMTWVSLDQCSVNLTDLRVLWGRLLEMLIPRSGQWETLFAGLGWAQERVLLTSIPGQCDVGGPRVTDWWRDGDCLHEETDSPKLPQVAYTRKQGFNHTHFLLSGGTLCLGRGGAVGPGWLARNHWRASQSYQNTPWRRCSSKEVKHLARNCAKVFRRFDYVYKKKSESKKYVFVAASQRKCRFQYKSVWEPPKGPIPGTWWRPFDWILTQPLNVMW